MLESEGLIISIAVEAPVAFLLARLKNWTGRGAWHVPLACCVATAVTHPQVWSAALWAYPRFYYWPTTFLLEGAVILVEGFLIAWMAGLPLRYAMTVSLAANVASFLVGLALYVAAIVV
jgi:hypothetical protein